MILKDLCPHIVPVYIRIVFNCLYKIRLDYIKSDPAIKYIFNITIFLHNTINNISILKEFTKVRLPNTKKLFNKFNVLFSI